MEFLNQLKKKYESKLSNYSFESKEEALMENIHEYKLKEKDSFTALEIPYVMESRGISKKVDGSKSHGYEEYTEDESSSLISWCDEPFYDDLRMRIDLIYKGRQIVENSEITIVKNEKYGLIGRNGIGKSTLLKAIAKRKFNIPKGVKICAIKQDFVSDEKVIDFVGADGGKILRKMGFTKKMEEVTLRSLSGGWRMRAQIARAIHSEPDLLLLDEPTNFLDLKAILYLEQEIKNMRSVIIVSHDRNFLNSTTNYTMNLEHQKIEVYRGNYDEFERQKDIERKSLQREYEKQMEQRMHLQSFIDRFRYSASRSAQAQSKIKILEKMPKLVVPSAERKIQFDFEYSRINGTIFEMNDVSFGYEGNEMILRGASLKIKHTSRIVVVGENGEGKSTLLKLMSGLLESSEGVIVRHGSLRVGYFAQHHVDHLDHNENALSLICKRGFREEDARSAMAQFGLNIGNQKIGTLSGGQKSRLAFALVSLSKPNLLILDEPTNQLDMGIIEALRDAICKFPGAVVCVSHDLSFISQTFKEVFICGEGKLSKYNGTPQEYKDGLIKSL